jgi:hypothetical protein
MSAARIRLVMGSALALLALLAAPAIAAAQHALPAASLTGTGLELVSIRAPDADGLPVRIVLGHDAVRVHADVWVEASADAAHARLDAARTTGTTHGLAPRTDVPHALAFADARRAAPRVLVIAASNVVIALRTASQTDLVALARHLAAAVLASTPPTSAAPALPQSLDASTAIARPADASAFLVRCEGACSARRTPTGFLVARAGTGSATLAIDVVDAYLRVAHITQRY